MKKLANIHTGEIVDDLYYENILTGTNDIYKNVYIKDEQLYSKDYDLCNCVIKLTENNLIEVIDYNKDFIVPKVQEIDNEIINSNEDLITFDSFVSMRKYKLVDDVAIPIKADCNINDFMYSQLKSRKRAINNFYDYALTNTWEYFGTFTFESENIRNDKDLLSYSWKIFVQYLRRKSKDVKAIATYEEFKKGGYHIHALISNVDLSLVPARNNKEFINDKSNPNYKKFLYSKFGQQIFNCSDWKLGFNSIVCLSADSNNQQVVNYLSKYITKACPAPYGCRRFFRTRNLTARKTIVANKNYREIEELIDRFELKLCKTDKAGNLYYRNY